MINEKDQEIVCARAGYLKFQVESISLFGILRNMVIMHVL